MTQRETLFESIREFVLSLRLGDLVSLGIERDVKGIIIDINHFHSFITVMTHSGSFMKINLYVDVDDGKIKGWCAHSADFFPDPSFNVIGRFNDCI